MKKIMFISATRADYGKIKAILKALEADSRFELHIFVTGMHMLEKFGNTASEITAEKFANVTLDEDYHYEPHMDLGISNVIKSFSSVIRRVRPDMIVVHGDRLDAIAGAIVGAFNNILVGHIEGGEVSGTIDESIRHAISKFANIHFVANEEAKKRLIQMGEDENAIHITGSPDIDIMQSDSLPALDKVLEHYEIASREYAILLHHPVVSEVGETRRQIQTVLDAIRESGKYCVAIYPNNDPGNEDIRRAYEKGMPRLRVIPSMRFESFLTLLKNAEFIIGNSSAGIREACVYGVPAIDIGSRQSGRYNPEVLRNIIHVDFDKKAILAAMDESGNRRRRSSHFGQGDSTDKFLEIVGRESLWEMPVQKRFVDLSD